MPKVARSVTPPRRSRKSTASTPEAAPPPKPPTADESTLRRRLDEAADWIEGARAAVDELLFTVQDATAARSMFKKRSLRRAGYDDGVEALRCLRFSLEQIDAIRGRAVPPRSAK